MLFSSVTFFNKNWRKEVVALNKVLLVDDEFYIINSLKHRINWTEYGFEIMDDAKNGQEAYEKIKRYQPDLVLADINMPIMNGLELIGKISQEMPNIKFIVVSGYTEFQYAKEAMNYGAIGYCNKPFDDDELIELLIRADKELKRNKNAEDYEHNESRPNPSYGTVKNVTFRSILNYIDDNYLNGYISVKEISDNFHLSENYISQLFKKEMNISFTDYTTNKRMEYACRLLKNSDAPISEVANQSGYYDYFHFAKVFKKKTGYTPTDYRCQESRQYQVI